MMELSGPDETIHPGAGNYCAEVDESLARKDQNASCEHQNLAPGFMKLKFRYRDVMHIIWKTMSAPRLAAISLTWFAFCVVFFLNFACGTSEDALTKNLREYEEQNRAEELPGVYEVRGLLTNKENIGRQHPSKNGYLARRDHFCVRPLSTSGRSLGEGGFTIDKALLK